MTPDPIEQIAAPPTHAVALAIDVSGYSPCRSHRGVVIFDGVGNVITHGYNYKPRGFDCDQTAACKATCRLEAIHAEQQALLLAGRRAEGADMLHVKTINGQLVESGGPSCVECSKLARVAGIAGVWLYHADGWRRYPIVEFHELSLAALRQQREAGQPQDELDAKRYRRLRILGAAPGENKQLEQGTVLRVTNLDRFVDEDLRFHASRGEPLRAEAQPTKEQL